MIVAEDDCNCLGRDMLGSQLKHLIRVYLMLCVISGQYFYNLLAVVEKSKLGLNFYDVGFALQFGNSTKLSILAKERFLFIVV
jgi:hypothetical protein